MSPIPRWTTMLPAMLLLATIIAATIAPSPLAASVPAPVAASTPAPVAASTPAAAATAAPAAAAPAPADIDSTTLIRPPVVAYRVINPITVDGLLTESDYTHPPITNFVQRDPQEGKPSTQKTEVWVNFDDAALYVSARLSDTAPDSIVSRLGRRDAFLSGDRFYVGIDSYHDKRTGFYFRVYSSGAVNDGTLYNDSWNDDSWDGVWDAATNVDDKGWTVEIRIPYSQLRFADAESYTWGINFGRMIERHNEESYYIMVPKNESGWVSRFAELQGIQQIHPPGRLEVLPYVVGSTETNTYYTPGDPFDDGSSVSGNVGADFKLGLGSNLTLNGTINPDFGQVEVDPAVVNLSAFETFYSEKRPFFVEGMNLFEFGFGGANSNWGFNFGVPEFFYSRRVGRAPTGSSQGDGWVDYPDATTILGAGKLTGKIQEGWSLAAISALTANEEAITEDDAGNRSESVVEPLSSYNVFRSQKEFDGGRNAIGVLWTGTFRNLGQEYLPSQFSSSAQSLGADGWWTVDSAGVYVINGWFSGSTVNGSPERLVDIQRSSLHYYQRPDLDHVELDSSRTSLSGYGGRVAINKQKGNFKLHSALGFISPGLEVNDLGFMFRADVVNMHLMLGYQWYDPDGIFRRKGFNVATFRNFDFGGNKTDEGYMAFYNFEFTNYWGFEGNVAYNPATLDRNGTRGGPFMMYTDRYGAWIGAYSDQRKMFSVWWGVEAGRSESGGYFVGTWPEFSIKPGSNLSLMFSPSFVHDVTIAQWVTNQADPTASATYGTRHVFGTLDYHEYSGAVRVDWTFSPKLSLQVYAQPLIAVGSYDGFKELKAERTYTFNEYGIDNGSTINYVDSVSTYYVDPDGGGPAAEFQISQPDFNFKSLRGNAVLRWEFLPGSTAYFVYTHQRTDDANPGSFDFGRDVKNLASAEDYQNVFMVKVAYWWHP